MIDSGQVEIRSCLCTQKKNKPLIVKKLTEALMSEDYKKGKETLRRYDFYCVLGVACDVSNLGSWSSSDKETYSYDVDDDWKTIKLPKKVADYYGFDEFGTIDEQTARNILGEETCNQIRKKLCFHPEEFI